MSKILDFFSLGKGAAVRDRQQMPEHSIQPQVTRCHCGEPSIFVLGELRRVTDGALLSVAWCESCFDVVRTVSTAQRLAFLEGRAA